MADVRMALGAQFLALSMLLLAGTMEAMAASTTTSYWYGGSLHPLVVTRDGVNYLVIGKQVVETVGSEAAHSYLHSDQLGSIRMATDDQGRVVQSLSYDDYGLTRIAGESSAAAEDGMASFYRFQGQEQEAFPLAKLGIDNEALAQWLDQIQLYHFPWRDYGAGLAVFTQTDPIPRDDSLYAALGANPVNFTDETGGMWGVLGDIDPEVQQLLDQIVQRPHESLTLAQYYQVRETINRLVNEDATRLRQEADDQEDMFVREIRKLETAREELVKARREGRIGRLNFETSMRHLSIELSLINEYKYEFNVWWVSYGLREQNYVNALNRYIRLHEEHLILEELARDEKEREETDEKNDDSEDTSRVESQSSQDNEIVPLARQQDQENIEEDTSSGADQSNVQDTSSDEDVLIDMPTRGGNRQEVDEPALRPAREEDRPFRCCNIL